ncbi:ATP-binding cassette sub-family G member 1 [Daktulosphaira vitifoliae]|uniref:ATP-binding cassette sub-family G member 1 n=1 Tax=Daktulosphaira vitifoliae TaxID=58002 RepID=UPI0021AA931E|nr:ATP-binding cassette sub-family G member 1 [Daktulosphaira vitifoliae]
MGPSGGGKSTLLNVLAGYSVTGSGGSVYLNNISRDHKCMSKISCYIQQDDYVRDLLTVRESMIVASHLKLPPERSTLSKIRQVEDLLDALGLSVHGDTITKRLSGGQKKRLSIALELITNPSIIFLDEPTTGLDSLSCSQFVSLMVDLAHNQGRTMICTLHQPSALLFEKFDQVYTLSAGRCIFQGPPSFVIPYFAERAIICPPYHNPADFLIEIAIGDYGPDVLVKLAESLTKDNYYKKNIICISGEQETIRENGMCLKKLDSANGKNQAPFTLSKSSTPPPLYLQAYHLYVRNIIAFKRNKNQLALRLSAHLVIALIFGYLYRNVGNDGSQVLGNMVFVYGTNLFLVYTGQMAVVVSFPLEYKILKREHFNRWYSLFPYLVSTLMVEIPFQILCCLTYILPSYVLTGQPLEFMRFSYFTIIAVVTSITAQSTGFLCGATLPVKMAVFVGPVSIVTLSVFGFAIQLKDVPLQYIWVYHFSFMRASFTSLMNTLYGFSREIMPCSDEIYCHFKYPDKFLKEMGIMLPDIYPEFYYLCFILFCTTILTSTCVWYRLNKR